MPELPEVETIVRGLKSKLTEQEFSHIEVRLAKSVWGPKNSFIASLKRRKILSMERRGKYFIFRLSDGKVLLIHLRMTGRLIFSPPDLPREKHTHVIFSFKDCPSQLRFVDQRQFGRLRVEKPSADGRLESLASLGPEPLEISPRDFIRRAKARHREIKPLLLDQEFLAGVGNIYADEALYQARIHPRRMSDALSEKNLLRLYRSLTDLLRKAIRAGGTSVRTFVNGTGSAGRFQNFLQVYGREGQACKVCGGPIGRERVGGRSSFFCPHCQRVRMERRRKPVRPGKGLPVARGKMVA